MKPASSQNVFRNIFNVLFTLPYAQVQGQLDGLHRGDIAILGDYLMKDYDKRWRPVRNHSTQLVVELTPELYMINTVVYFFQVLSFKVFGSNYKIYAIHPIKYVGNNRNSW